jgi:hypothetical protein
VGGWIINAIEGDYELPNEYMALLAESISKRGLKEADIDGLVK